MVTCPSNSPEHGPEGDEKKNAPSTVAGCTMDNQIVFDLFSNTLRACKILAEDAAYAEHLQKMIDRLPPMQIGRYNQLQEWLEDVDDPTSEHRHVSHLFGLYPGNRDISLYRSSVISSSKEFFNLSWRSGYGMVYRLENKLVGEITGWKSCF